MDLQERLIELSEYGISFNVANGNFVVKIQYPKDWSIFQPINNDIGFYRDENNELLYYYVAPVTISIEEIFASIDEIFDYNKELELKVKLFKEKMTELQEIFSKESLEVLNTLEFKLKKKKDKQKKEKNVAEAEIKENTEAKKAEETKEEEIKPSEIDEKINKVLKKK